jgi:hypothetical protein
MTLDALRAQIGPVMQARVAELQAFVELAQAAAASGQLPKWEAVPREVLATGGAVTAALLLLVLPQPRRLLTSTLDTVLASILLVLLIALLLSLPLGEPLAGGAAEERLHVLTGGKGAVVTMMIAASHPLSCCPPPDRPSTCIVNPPSTHTRRHPLHLVPRPAVPGRVAGRELPHDRQAAAADPGAVIQPRRIAASPGLTICVCLILRLNCMHALFGGPPTCFLTVHIDTTWADTLPIFFDPSHNPPSTLSS